MSRSRWLLVAPALALLPMACGDDDPSVAATTSAPTATTATTAAPPSGGPVDTAPESSDDLPPESFNALVSLYQPVLDDLDVELARGALTEYGGGPHLALYVVPRSPEGGAQGYLDRIVPLVAALEPLLFERFPDLNSFDICQEPIQPGGVRSEEYPEAVTLLLLDREQVESVPDWRTATLVDLMRAVDDGPDGELRVSDEIEALPDWRDAEQDA